VALSVVALTVHGVIALVLMNGTVRRPPASAGSVVLPTAPGPPPTRGPAPSTPANPPTNPTASPGSGSALHIDHACLVADNPPTSARIASGDPFGSDLSHLGTGAELQRLYVVRNGSLAAADGGGPVRDCDEQLWRIVVAATPPDALTYIDELLIFDADLSTGSELYVGEVMAQPGTTESASHWRLSLAPNGASDLEVALTVAHEVGHLVSLSRSQMTGQDEKACQTLYTGTGCLRDDAAFFGFLTENWTEDVFDEWSTADATTDDAKRTDALEAFYEKYEDQFVDAYAATDPAEDFAESFGIWCAIGPSSPLLPQLIEGDPSNGKAKLDWFEQSAEVKNDVLGGCQRLRALTR
jgi:hypothetical protein